jgi:predicted RNase H-like HicB family nuclease
MLRFPLTAYFEAAMELARYEKLEDGTYAGEIPKLPGVVSFGSTLRECEQELRSTVEDWVLVGLRLGHRLPKLAGIDLNRRHHGRVAAA